MFTIFFLRLFAEFSAIFRLKALRCMETLTQPNYNIDKLLKHLQTITTIAHINHKCRACYHLFTYLLLYYIALTI